MFGFLSVPKTVVSRVNSEKVRLDETTAAGTSSITGR
jgi:hypothetical protein